MRSAKADSQASAAAESPGASGSSRARARTRSGWRRASSVATQPPKLRPTTTAGAAPKGVEQRRRVVGVLAHGRALVRLRALAAPAAAPVIGDEPAEPQSRSAASAEAMAELPPP